MKPWRWKLYALRGWLTDIAHQSRHVSTWRHDLLEFVAYKLVDPLIWMQDTEEDPT